MDSMITLVGTLLLLKGTLPAGMFSELLLHLLSVSHLLSVTLIILAFSPKSFPIPYCPFVDSEGPCDDLQYLDLGETGVIQCNFGIDFYGVFWYNTTEHRTEDPFFYYVRPTKSGRGHTSGEFDIFENGSLVINNVSLQHEHFFRVVMFLEDQAEPKGPYDILVKVIGTLECFLSSVFSFNHIPTHVMFGMSYCSCIVSFSQHNKLPW